MTGDINRRHFLKILGVTSLCLAFNPLLKTSFSDASLDEILDSILPGEFVALAGVNTPFLRMAFQADLEKRGFAVLNYSDGRKDLAETLWASPDCELWQRFVTTNELYRNIARESQTPVIAVANTFSLTERPSFRESDLARFGALNQCADKIFFVRSGREDPAGNIPIVISVEKNRSGPTGAVARLTWNQRGALDPERITRRIRV